MALKTMLAKVKEARAAYKAALDEAGKDLQKSLAEYLAEALRQAPEEYVAVRWSQYSPYFNDGEACTFSVHEPFVLTTDSDEDERYEGAWYREEYYSAYYKKTEPEQHVGLKALNEAWSSIEEDIFERAFGDHVQITVRRDGSFSVDDRGHD
jgi:hypothetical protein